MKKQFYLLPLLLLVSVSTSPVFARGHKGGGGNPTALPINSGIVYLAIVALVIGLATLYNFKLKTVKA